MKLSDLTAKIYEAAQSKAHLEELLYLRDERLGILCGSAEPTEEQVQITHDQLFQNEL